MNLTRGTAPIQLDLTPYEARLLADFLQFSGSDEELEDETIDVGEEVHQALREALRA